MKTTLDICRPYLAEKELSASAVARVAEALLHATAAAGQSWRKAVHDLAAGHLITEEAGDSIIRHIEGVYVTEGAETGPPLRSYFPSEQEALQDMKEVWLHTDVRLVRLLYLAEGVETTLWRNADGIEALEQRMAAEGISLDDE